MHVDDRFLTRLALALHKVVEENEKIERSWTAEGQGRNPFR